MTTIATSPKPPKPIRPLVKVTERKTSQGHERRVRFSLHKGQRRAWDSKKRFILLLAGTQSGKTSYGPVWLWNEIRNRGPGDYLVVTPTFPLLIKKALPEFLRLFGRRGMMLGEYHVQKKIFEFSEEGARAMWPDRDVSEPTQIFFGHATDPESLESATAKAAWCDEFGQGKVKLESWEAIQRRLSIHQGRALITTTPYSLSWLKQRLWDPWVEAGRNHPEIDVVRFESIQNPAFPRDEFERARREIPGWRFDLFYRAIFSRPAGQIYDCYDPVRHRCPRFSLPDHWPRFLGLDFGGTNTAGTFWAAELDHNNRPTRRYFCYREYRGGKHPDGTNMTVAEHILRLMAGEPKIPYCVGGSWSEGNWRAEFAQGGRIRDDKVAGGWRVVHGMPVHAPSVKEVAVGIARVYAAFQRDELIIFDDLHGLLDEIGSYSYEVDEAGEPIPDAIQDKEIYHILDSARYVLGFLKKDPASSPERRQATIRGGLNLNGPMQR